MRASGKRDEPGTLPSREVSEWPLWMGTKWPERQGDWKDGRGRGGVCRPEVDRLHKGKAGEKSMYLGELV